MKLFNLSVRSGKVEVEGPFATETAQIENARSFHFSHGDDFDAYIFKLGVDHNGNPNVTTFSEDEIEAETIEA